MIRSLDLQCSMCNRHFTAVDKLYYQDDFTVNDFKRIKLICSDCLQAWEDSLQVESAVFREKDCFLYVDLVLKNGERHLNLDCTPMDNIVVTGIDLPETAKQRLFEIYSEWLYEKRKDMIRECSFKDEFMRTTFSCVTFSGEKYESIAFRFNRKGELETEVPVPVAILKQVVEAWQMCELTGNNHFIVN